ncbi:PREDICTED: rho GDP-dissociation inhibitor 2 isoform X3 [Myotis davidii]|uniref:rho GDP-dissociation inhibitor 2 isoform X3 n=1 Tax=Myotis davidii TaxID=225400 RepID=UPI00076751CE|nr:PREDICTED: rho GDP-dissociation inhibitor 2 isoform X3 [Myotis davidii]
MTEKAPEPQLEEEEDDLDGKLNYKPPPQKSLQELQEMDKDDESLTKYKKTLLGDGPVVVDPKAPNVTVTRLTLVCESAPGPITMDLTGDLQALKKETFVLKEGVEYRVKICFKEMVVCLTSTALTSILIPKASSSWCGETWEGGPGRRREYQEYSYFLSISNIKMDIL